jgi:2-oxo-4-hydroxy-4-carboxy--5-ureidoimidazoline (OHCU) decarboxylase
MLPPIEELNGLDTDEFERALAPLFEGAPRFCARLAEGRPYSSYGQLLDRAALTVRELPEEEQVELIDCHPRIGADPRTVSAISYREQGYDGAAEATSSQATHGTQAAQAAQAALDRLNAAYEQQFGFRFVVHVAGRPRATIVPLIKAALRRRREEEIERALSDIVAIARDRLSTLLANQEERV